MKIYDYDIWDGDKGIILANDYHEAFEMFKKNYPDIPVCPEEVDEYDTYVCCIRTAGEVTNEPHLFIMD